MRLLPIALVFASALLLAPAFAFAATSNDRAYAGAITHDIVYKPSAFATVYRAAYGVPECHGAGVATIHVDLTTGKMEIVNPDTQCIPGFSTLSQGCRLDADQHVRCARDVGRDSIRMDIAPSGEMVFTWDAATFNERIAGVVARVN